VAKNKIIFKDDQCKYFNLLILIIFLIWNIINTYFSIKEVDVLADNINIIGTLPPITILIYVLKIFYISIFSNYTFLRILNIKPLFNKTAFFIILVNVFVSSICGIMKFAFDSFISVLSLLILLSFTHSFFAKIKFGYSILVTVISLSINYILFFVAIFISFIFNLFLAIENDYINLLFMIAIHFIFLKLFWNTKKFKNGFSFFTKISKNEYFDILILNISISLLFLFILLNNFQFYPGMNIILSFIVFAIIAFITIQKTFSMYYKHKLLVNELNDTKAELDEKNKEIKELEAENLQFSKTAHSIAHRQKSLEHKLNELMLKTETASEIDIRDRLNSISNECFVSSPITLPKTDIEIIDDMLSYMHSECKENSIDFELILSGNMHHMINNLIAKEELEILLADHIKDAIIAINHSDNINKSILVKLGLFDGNYSLSIYDSGIEFEIPTLINVGIKPSTTHKDNGGSGMGFMNTFETLKKHNASLYINEINKPTKDNYTKSITISFNNKNEYKISSYRAKEIKEKNNRDDLIVE